MKKAEQCIGLFCFLSLAWIKEIPGRLPNIADIFEAGDAADSQGRENAFQKMVKCIRKSVGDCRAG